MAKSKPGRRNTLPRERPISLLIKPVSGDCNLRCRYCFYLSVPGEVYPETKKHRMPPDVLRAMTREFLSLRCPVSNFAWQGGEPTLAGLDFFRDAIEAQKEFGVSGQSVSNSLQTNGILLDEDWCAFLREYHFLIGLSIDGPADIHNHYRVTASGSGSHDNVLRALRLLQREQVEHNILCVVNKRNVRRAKDLYNYFRGLGVRHAQFIPAIEQDTASGEIAEFTPSPEEYGEFLCEMFDTWIEGGIREFSVRDFEAILAKIVDGAPALCIYGDRCDDYLLIEHNGDVYPCDFFCRKDLYLGNIAENPIREILHSPKRNEFADLKRAADGICRGCEWLEMCHGGCTKDRIHGGWTPDRPTYLCGAYKRFFSHAWDRMLEIRDEVLEERKERARHAMMQAARQQSPTGPVKRNDPCPCGSGKKYKHCCGS